MTPSVVIVDYGMGNLGSVVNMLRKIGASVALSSDPAILRAATRLILPGVGAFDHGIQQLRKNGIFELIQERAAAGTPLLGLCLGMQLLVNGSEEGDEHGLGLVDAECRKFVFPADSRMRVPHVGWNEPVVVRESPLLFREDAKPRFYFTHSYYVDCRDRADVIATVDYGHAFHAVIGRGSVYGVQFHPEKSHRFGMALLRRFVAVPEAPC